MAPVNVFETQFECVDFKSSRHAKNRFMETKPKAHFFISFANYSRASVLSRYIELHVGYPWSLPQIRDAKEKITLMSVAFNNIIDRAVQKCTLLEIFLMLGDRY